MPAPDRWCRHRSRPGGPMRYLLSLCAALALACGDHAPSAPSDPLAALAGSWTTTAWELRTTGNPTRTFDLSAHGWSLALVLQASGAFSLTVTTSAGPGAVQTGTLTIRGDTLLNHTADTDARFTYSSAGGTMMWETVDTETDDLDGDGVEETYLEHIVLRRQ